MESKRMLRQAAFPQNDAAHAVGAEVETKFHEEDGWIFREFPGKRVECIGRAGDVSLPYMQRHNYPSH